jgi:hypothetical protein
MSSSVELLDARRFTVIFRAHEVLINVGPLFARGTAAPPDMEWPEKSGPCEAITVSDIAGDGFELVSASFASRADIQIAPPTSNRAVFM